MGLSTDEAAEIMGCTSAHVRLMCRLGKLPHTKRKSKYNHAGYEYIIERAVAIKHKNKPKGTRGRPRKGVAVK